VKPTLEVKKLSKSFHEEFGKNPISFLFKKKKKNLRKITILDDINFSIKKGEALGLIGKNGAGKSSLLKIISGTSIQTSGDVNVNGKVSSILELGLGFHPELTGRENVRNMAKLMLLDNHTIDSSLSFVEDFSNIGHYFDEPMRLYSSGMMVRVAFAFATSVRPNLLIVDEAIAVGDISFQRKCFERIESFKQKGTSILFVSHDLKLVKRICDKVIFLKEGNQTFFGDSKIGCEIYEKSLSTENDDSPQSLVYNNKGAER